MKRQYPRSVLVVWEDHWYDPDGEITTEVAAGEGPKPMYSVGWVVAETETAFQLALDCSEVSDNPNPKVFRHRAFYDKRMIKEIIEMRPYRRRKKADQLPTKT